MDAMNNKNDKNTVKRPAQKLGGPMGGMMHGEKAKDFKSAIKSVVKYMGSYKFAVFFVMIFAVVGTAFNVIGPKIMGRATTELANGLREKISGTGGINFDAIAHVLLLTLLIYAVGAVFNFLQGYTMSTITQRICYRLRRDISEKIDRMPMKYFEERTYGEILSRITNDVDTLGQGLNQSVSQLIMSVSMIVGVIIMMLTINILMTAITLILLPLSAALIGLVVKKSQKHFATQQEYLGHVNGQVEEVYGGQTVVKAFNKEADVLKTFHETNEVLYKSAWKSQFLSGMMFPIVNFVSNLGYVGVVISGALFAIQGKVTLGDIQAFVQYVKFFTQPIQQLAQVMNMLQSMAAAAERVFEFLNEAEEDETAENNITAEHVRGLVEFKNVRFGYNDNQTVLHSFSSIAKPGQKIAIVGPTGAGKTTLVKLLMRFYDVDDGAILLDGHDIREYSRRGLRSAFSMVLQDTWLFNGTIMENIRYGKLDATDEEVIAAAKAAHAHHFIEALPDGYQMALNEEANNVSAGQKQLLTIARAILANRPVLILDEATSSVDTRTEVSIQRAMDNLMQGRTSFIIAHRLSTIRDADVILVVRDGDIVEQGNHEELMQKDGFYAELYNSQFEEIPA